MRILIRFRADNVTAHQSDLVLGFPSPLSMSLYFTSMMRAIGKDRSIIAGFAYGVEDVEADIYPYAAGASYTYHKPGEVASSGGLTLFDNMRCGVTVHAILDTNADVSVEDLRLAMLSNPFLGGKIFCFQQNPFGVAFYVEEAGADKTEIFLRKKYFVVDRSMDVIDQCKKYDCSLQDALRISLHRGIANSIRESKKKKIENGITLKSLLTSETLKKKESFDLVNAETGGPGDTSAMEDWLQQQEQSWLHVQPMGYRRIGAWNDSRKGCRYPIPSAYAEAVHGFAQHKKVDFTDIRQAFWKIQVPKDSMEKMESPVVYFVEGGF